MGTGTGSSGASSGNNPGSGGMSTPGGGASNNSGGAGAAAGAASNASAKGPSAPANTGASKDAAAARDAASKTNAARGNIGSGASTSAGAAAAAAKASADAAKANAVGLGSNQNTGPSKSTSAPNAAAAAAAAAANAAGLAKAAAAKAPGKVAGGPLGMSVGKLGSVGRAVGADPFGGRPSYKEGDVIGDPKLGYTGDVNEFHPSQIGPRQGYGTTPLSEGNTPVPGGIGSMPTDKMITDRPMNPPGVGPQGYHLGATNIAAGRATPSTAGPGLARAAAVTGMDTADPGVMGAARAQAATMNASPAQIGMKGGTFADAQMRVADKNLKTAIAGPLGSKFARGYGGVGVSPARAIGGEVAGVGVTGPAKTTPGPKATAAGYTAPAGLQSRNTMQQAADVTASMVQRASQLAHPTGVRPSTPNSTLGAAYNSVTQKNVRDKSSPYNAMSPETKSAVAKGILGGLTPSTGAFGVNAAPAAKEATHYFNRDASNPKWGNPSAFTQVGPHAFGTPTAERAKFNQGAMSQQLGLSGVVTGAGTPPSARSTPAPTAVAHLTEPNYNSFGKLGLPSTRAPAGPAYAGNPAGLGPAPAVNPGTPGGVPPGTAQAIAGMLSNMKSPGPHPSLGQAPSTAPTMTHTLGGWQTAPETDITNPHVLQQAAAPNLLSPGPHPSLGQAPSTAPTMTHTLGGWQSAPESDITNPTIHAPPAAYTDPGMQTRNPAETVIARTLAGPTPPNVQSGVAFPGASVNLPAPPAPAPAAPAAPTTPTTPAPQAPPGPAIAEAQPGPPAVPGEAPVDVKKALENMTSFKAMMAPHMDARIKSVTQNKDGGWTVHMKDGTSATLTGDGKMKSTMHATGLAMSDLSAALNNLQDMSAPRAAPASPFPRGDVFGPATTAAPPSAPAPMRGAGPIAGTGTMPSTAAPSAPPGQSGPMPGMGMPPAGMAPPAPPGPIAGFGPQNNFNFGFSDLGGWKPGPMAPPSATPAPGPAPGPAPAPPGNSAPMPGMGMPPGGMAPPSPTGPPTGPSVAAPPSPGLQSAAAMVGASPRGIEPTPPPSFPVSSPQAPSVGGGGTPGGTVDPAIARSILSGMGLNVSGLSDAALQIVFQQVISGQVKLPGTTPTTSTPTGTPPA